MPRSFRLSSFFILVLVIFANTGSKPASAEDKNLILRTAGMIGGMTQTITEPVRNPRAAFSRWFEFNPEIEKGAKPNFNVLPLFISSPERGQGLGLKMARESLWKKHDVVRAHILHTLKNKQEYRLKYEFPPDFMERWGGEFEIAFQNYQRYYYGIGREARKEDETEFTLEYFEARLPLLYQVRDRLFAGFAFNFENFALTEVGNAGILRRDLPNLKGRDGSRLYTTNLLLRWDTRDSKSDPSFGTLVEGSQEYSRKLIGSESDFNRSTLEIRQFFPLFSRRSQVLGLKVFMDYKSGSVPFYHLPELGGVFFNRGLIEGRFRDNLALTGNAEYRFKIYQRLHWAFFVDAGNVYRDFAFATFHRTKITGGTGMRYYVPPGNLLLARVDGGYSTEGFLVYLTFDHPF